MRSGEGPTTGSPRVRVARAAALAAVIMVPLLLGAASASPWERSDARLPHAPDGATVVATNAAVYLFGGRDADGDATDQVLRYDTDARTLEVLSARLPAPRSGMAGVWDGQQIILLGGIDQDGQHTRQAWRFDAFRDAFKTSRALLPEARTGVLAVQAGQDTLVLGGTPCDPCPVLRLEGDGFIATNATLPGALTDAATYWDGRHVHVLGGHLDGNGTTASWRLDPSAATIEPGPGVPFPGPAQAAFDGLHAHVLFEADPTTLWRTRGGHLQRVLPEIGTPAPPMHVAGRDPIVLLGAGVGADAARIGIVHFDPQESHIPMQNPWCAPLQREPCDARAPGAGTPLLPLFGGLMLFAYLGAAVTTLRHRAEGGAVPRRERDRWIAIPAVAVLVLLVVTFRTWADIALGAARAHASPVDLDAPAAASWTDVARGTVVLTGTTVWLIGVATAALATAVLATRRRRPGARLALASGSALALGWSLIMTGMHIASDGAYLLWRPPAMVAFVAVVAFGMGVFMLLREDGRREDADLPEKDATDATDATKATDATAATDMPQGAGATSRSFFSRVLRHARP